MTDEITLRSYKPGDEDQIIALIVAIQREEFGIQITAADQPDLLTIPEFYQSGDGGFWVAERAGTIIGTIALKDIDNRQGALRKMFVAGNVRGPDHGIATKLLEELLAHARRKGTMDIYLGTNPALRAAHRFYEKNGFEKVAEADLPANFPLMKVDSIFYRLGLATSRIY
jgi:N-acetylglutamate synthase-like GNAT family acetyltransferase